MALTNSQYDSIMRTYEEKQYRSRDKQQAKLEYVNQNIPGYEELSRRISSLSVEQGKRLLDGEENALQELKSSLALLRQKKLALLTAAGLPENYLEPEYECKDCHDTGYIGQQKCHCFKQEIISLLYEQAQLNEEDEAIRFANLSYDFYEPEDLASFQKIVSSCYEFIDCFNSDYHNLFFYGKVGTGKSFLSICIAKELLEREYSVIYFSAANLFERISRYTGDFHAREELNDLFEDIYSCDLLIVDDLGTELNNNFSVSYFFTIINERILRKKSVIISTNFELQEIKARYTDRIFSRLISNYDFHKFTGPDIRFLKK